MKKAVRFLAFVFVMVFSLTLCACSRAVPDVISSRYENLAAGGRLENSSGKAGDSAVFRFPSKTKINAVVLKEIGNSVTSFRIYADDGETPFYGNDYIGDYRYCAFATKEVSSLRIEVTGSDAEWELHSLEAYCVDNGADDFEVVSYINADTAYTLSSEYAATAAFVTQFNVFGGTYFDAQGKVHFADFEVNGVKIDGEVLFEQAINNIRILNPDAEIVFTLLGNRDFGDGMNIRERHNSAMGLFGETLTSNILSVISEFDLDGVSFDYEYPETEEDFAEARRGLKLAAEFMSSGEYDLVVLDEINVAVDFGLLTADDVAAALDKKSEGTEVVLTGRNAPQEFIDRAALVTEMREVKHPYRDGVQARAGVEF